ncbi:unnamed protein product [Orchesella dallaii]|uniref:Uncharacterized protein n=1 Tax=Orchesella dallaii TaxID=48710 RepID=A0ABP1QQ16_9HEXA
MTHMKISSQSIFQLGITPVITVGKIFGAIIISSKVSHEGAASRKFISFTAFWKTIKGYWPTVYCFYTMFVNGCMLVFTVITFIRDIVQNTSISAKEYGEGSVQLIQDMTYHIHTFGTLLFGAFKCRELPRIYHAWKVMEAHLMYYEHFYATKHTKNKKWENSIFAKEMIFTSEINRRHKRFVRKSHILTVSYVVVGLFGGTLYFLYEYMKNMPSFNQYLYIVAGIYTVHEFETPWTGIYILLFGHVLEILWAYGDILIGVTAFGLHYQFKRFNKILHLACTEHANNLNVTSLEQLRVLHWALAKAIKVI